MSKQSREQKIQYLKRMMSGTPKDKPAKRMRIEGFSETKPATFKHYIEDVEVSEGAFFQQARSQGGLDWDHFEFIFDGINTQDHEANVLKGHIKNPGHLAQIIKDNPKWGKAKRWMEDVERFHQLRATSQEPDHVLIYQMVNERKAEESDGQTVKH